MSSASLPLRASQSAQPTRSRKSRSGAAKRCRRRLFLEQRENRSLLAAIGNALSAEPDLLHAR
jgi:hypothetical protein